MTLLPETPYQSREGAEKKYSNLPPPDLLPVPPLNQIPQEARTRSQTQSPIEQFNQGQPARKPDDVFSSSQSPQEKSSIEDTQ